MKIKKDELAIAILIPLAVGTVSSCLTQNAMGMFRVMPKPPLSPPGWLFPVVWTVLYVLMGIASFLVSREGREKPAVADALDVYALQLALNFFWSIFFFRFGWYLFSFLWLLVLWGLILVTILRFRKVNRRAASLMLPYLAWVTFAGYLNLGVYLLNF